MNSVSSALNTKHLYYPLFLDISGKCCTVVGGGRIAERKVAMLLKFNAKVKLISPKITKNLLNLLQSGKIEVVYREYRIGDLEGASLVFAATNINEINNEIKKEAGIKGILVNVVDDPAMCDFIVPSIVKKDPVVIAISTSGILPLLSGKLKKEINTYITKDYIKYAHVIGKFRTFLIETVKDRKRRRKIMSEINKIDMKEIIQMDIKEIKERFLKEKK